MVDIISDLWIKHASRIIPETWLCAPVEVVCNLLSKPQGLVRPEGLGKFKKITSSGKEPATFRFVA
jgi:hypothetical protein